MRFAIQRESSTPNPRVVTAGLPPHQRGVLEAVVQGRAGVTPFAWWAARAGLWPLLLGALAVLALRWKLKPKAGA